ncbi:hypothetical protein M8J77_001411 [Diaphorina citri]|nr:hypothetical protein M8J77_001411 [Diaphorina citri]
MISLSMNKSSSGIDSVPMSIIKRAAPYIAQPLAHIFSTSFQTNTFPFLFKLSTTIPIHKKGPLNDVNNYRPISLLISFSKLLEKIVALRLTCYLDHYNLLTEHQFGFRSGRSTSDAVTSFFRQLDAILSRGHLAVGIFCDLSRAFDCVDHDILLSKLPFYGVKNSSHSWFQSYLLNRLQRVKIPACIDGSKRDVFSSCLSVRAGVPQGSVLGPLLFLIYINDLIRCCQIAKFTLFADDTTILVSGQNHDGVVSNCTKALEDVQIWFLSNKLQLNANKTSFLCFGNRTPTPIPTLTIPQSNLVLRQATEVRFLGITMDAGLCWKLHIQALSSKLSSAVFALKSVRKNVDFRAGLSSYFAYFHSIMSYGILFWGFAAGTKEILLLQKRAVRAVFGLSRTTSCRPYFKDHNIPTFYAQLVLESVLAVRGLAEDLTKHSDVHNHDTRHKNKIVRSSSKPLTATFLNEGVKFYNLLPASMRDMNYGDLKVALKPTLVAGVPYTLEECLDLFSHP